MAGGSYRVASTFFVTVSLLLQIASIVSPGWIVDVRQNLETYSSLFYRMTCQTKLQTDCSAKSYYTIYKHEREVLDKRGAGRMAYIEHDKKLHDDIQELALVCVALLCTFIVFVGQIARTRNQDKDYKRVVAVSPTIAALAVGLMISVISRRVIYLYYMSKVRNLDHDSNHTYIGFPYSLTMYIIALLANTAGAIFNTCQTTGSLKKPRRKKRIDFEDEVPVQKKLPVPVSQTTTLEEPQITRKEEKAFDNPTFSVKL